MSGDSVAVVEAFGGTAGKIPYTAYSGSLGTYSSRRKSKPGHPTNNRLSGSRTALVLVGTCTCRL